MSPSGKPGGKAPRPFMDPGVAEATPSLYFSPLFFFFSLPLSPPFFSWDLLEGKEGREARKKEKKKEEKEKSSRPELPG